MTFYTLYLLNLIIASVWLLWLVPSSKVQLADLPCIKHKRMNASALLTRQGWLGNGHALDRAGRGVKKPLLVSRKSDTLGVGKKKVDVHADQWWARAFDEGLKGLNPGNDTIVTAVTAVTQDPKATKVSELDLLANGGKKWLGLYSGFVRGEGLEGTIGRDVVYGITVDAAGKSEEKRIKTKTNKRKADCESEEREVLISVSPVTNQVEDQGVKKHKKKKKSRKDTESSDLPVLGDSMTSNVEVKSSTTKKSKIKDSATRVQVNTLPTVQSVPVDRLKQKKKRKQKKSSSEG